MHFVLLADRTDAVPTVARWYFDEWGHAAAGNTFEHTCARINGKLNRNRVPLHVLAIEDDQVFGVAQLKLHEMNIYPEWQHWLGGVFVSPAARGRGIASALCREIQATAFCLGIRALYLQTEHLDGGLYARLGWRGVDRVRYKGYDVLVMEKSLDL